MAIVSNPYCVMYCINIILKYVQYNIVKNTQMYTFIFREAFVSSCIVFEMLSD